jgi:hypothetical protein
MKQLLLVTAMLTAITSGGMAHATNNPRENNSSPSSDQSQVQGQYQGQTAAAISGSKSSSDSVSQASSGATSSSSSGSSAEAQGGDASSSLQSESDVDVAVTSNSHRSYPDIPVNAGVTFASVCQEGTSATNSRLSIAITTDSTFCDHLRLADSYHQLMSGYVESCDKAYADHVASTRHQQLVISQYKGAAQLPPSVWDSQNVASCKRADSYEEKMLAELKQAQDYVDRTHGTGIFAKWANQIGIPVSLLSVLLMAL